MVFAHLGLFKKNRRRNDNQNGLWIFGRDGQNTAGRPPAKNQQPWRAFLGLTQVFPFV
jgi:hypothetical protein